MNPQGIKIKFSVLAPAKINLTLRVTGRRPNGYHDLDMRMVKLSLCDEIDIEAGEGDLIEISADSPHVPNDASNSMWKAVELLRRETGKNLSAKISIRKRIPVAAGLGGGTSDAASVLKGLNEKLDLGVSPRRLRELAVQIGADVPFFLAEGPQRVRGIGDILEPTEIEPLFVVLMNPGFPVSTAHVYRWYDEEQEKKRGEVLTASKTDDNPRELENDLERVVIPRYPVLAKMKQELLKAGALGALMSGSGGTVFGLYDSKASRDQGYEAILRIKKPEWWMCRTQSE